MEKTSKKKQKSQNTGLSLGYLEPLTTNQTQFFKAFHSHQVLSLSGYAGTGKSLIALYKALEAIEKRQFKQVKIIRSAVSTRSIGYLPGTKEEKMEVYEAPYISLCSVLYNRDDAYQILKNHKVIDFQSSSYLRGETFMDSVIIVDESQNMLEQELTTIITRFGDNCKMILCGDINQDDLSSDRYKEYSGYTKILKILERMDECKSIFFGVEDIVRSGFVKNFIIQYNK